MSTLPTYGSLPVQIDPTAWAGRTENLPVDQDAVQQQIATRLRALLAAAGLDIAVYVFNDFDYDTWWKSSAIAFILISYIDTNFGKPIATSAMVQEMTMHYHFHIEARTISWSLTGGGSVYQLIKAIEIDMTGFRPNGCRHTYFTDERFSEQRPDGSVWLYDLTYNVVTVRPMQPDSYALANLAKVIYNIQPGGDQVVVTPTLTEE